MIPFTMHYHLSICILYMVWRFPSCWGVPLNHPFMDGFSIINHPKLAWGTPISGTPPHNQWEFQDPKLEVLYLIRPYFGCISPYIGLNNRPSIWYIGTSNQSDPESWPLT